MGELMGRPMGSDTYSAHPLRSEKRNSLPIIKKKIIRDVLAELVNRRET